MIMRLIGGELLVLFASLILPIIAGVEAKDAAYVVAGFFVVFTCLAVGLVLVFA